MVNAKVKKTFRDIKALKIQGARNIAKGALISLKSVKNKKELGEASALLSQSRPTEPMMRNGLKFVKYKASTGTSVSEAVDDYLNRMDLALEKIADLGSKKISSGDIVMTHCHSSTVMSIIKKAADDGKNVSVISTETRPLFQGRKTAQELAAYGVPVLSVVDSAMRSYVGKADICIVGSDAITAEGNLINKVGTSLLALCAKETGKTFAVAAETFKFDPKTLSGWAEPMEERDPSEVWKIKKKNLFVKNPAFDITPADHISYLITEKGILMPQNISFFASNTYRWMF